MIFQIKHLVVAQKKIRIYFNLTMDGKVKGSFIKKLITDGSYAEFRAYKSEEAKKTSATLNLIQVRK